MLPKQLSRADSAVLAQVFDPESAASRAEIIIDPSLPEDRHIHNAALLAQLRTREREAISIIEDFERNKARFPDVKESAKDAAYRAALTSLDALIAEFPNYASARNNRAQMRRWRFGDRNTLVRPNSLLYADQCAGGVAAEADLKACIIAASPARPQDAVSPAQGKLLAQAYTQLGALYHAAAKDLESGNAGVVAAIDGVKWNGNRFEEEASRAFYLGGLYGNEVAKALAVHTNPHAKLCGSIVKEAMRNEMETAW
ncbi:Putative tetratricopeptide repeat protein [Septoria linicola]|uniref:Tetratricopeptide repeat protein n=1 Tax=Septoria linicola TaxID=215465 RepID=A0A9Q9AZR2_9PEZI|nr:Putative tetratricopeptide repeat protein [Septoria linicola]